ncbi:MAG: DUF1284 domain-containing protein [Firmicutes bacterium]|nr:DUF1284 domain-containing protein [Bacillota bacterium]
MIKLRGHHLICLRFFLGEGYSQKFIDNLKDLVERAEKREVIEVVAGGDDVCRFCPSLVDDRCSNDDPGIRQLDSIALKRLGAAVGELVYWPELGTRLESAPPGWLDAFCEGCIWEAVCQRVKA